MRLFQLKRRSAPVGDAEAEARPLRAFVTGATGYLGSAIVRELVAAGHEVCGMTRWAEKTLDIAELGARAVVGDALDSLTFRRVAAEYDVLIHAAQTETLAQRAEADRGAIEALLWAASQPAGERAGGAPPRAFIYTSGCFMLGNTGEEPADEERPLDDVPPYVAWRVPHERMVLDAGSDALATAVVRPGMIYGGGDSAFAGLFESAAGNGAAEHVGDGANRWSPAYLGDVARLYRLIAERRARGVFHCAEESAVTVAELARAASIAAGAAGRTRAVPVERARETLGGFADAAVLDQALACTRSQQLLGWRHEHGSFVDTAAEVYAEWRSGGSG